VGAHHASPTTLPSRVAHVLDRIKATDAGQLAISEDDGRFLRALVSMRGAGSVLEIGGASGYSGIWLGLGARASGGRVVSIEYDPARAAEAAANIEAAGLADVVRVVHGDAFEEIPKLSGSFDLVFLDAWKPDYKRFFDLVFPRLTVGGVFVAHNVVNKKNEMKPFLETVATHPRLFTTIVSPSHEGMSVSYRTR
jgi:predicted O-methyltransferase YrrM